MAAKTTDWRPGPTVCRCCLSEGCYKDISTEYFWMGKREVYSEMLSETFSLSIAYSTSGGPNSNSRLICEPCISRLRDASDFKRQVQECEKTFMQYLDPGTERLSDFETAESRIEVTLESLETEVKVEQVKTEKDESDGDDFGDRTDFPDLDDDDDDLDDQPLTRLATRVPKKESVDTEADSKPEKRKATTKAKTSPAKKAKTKKEVVKATTSKAAKPTEKKKKEISQANRNAAIILLNTTAYPFKLLGQDMVCMYCYETYNTPSMFRQHMEAEHEEFNVNIVLNRNFALVKVDCTSLQCRHCKHFFTNLDEIARHLIDDHGLTDLALDGCLGVTPYTFVDDKFACAICQLKFSNLRGLSRHTQSHFLIKSCKVCGKSYSSRAALHQHVKINHSSSAPACKKCKKEFQFAEDLKNHLLESKACCSYSCKMCSERFYSWSVREIHMEEVHGRKKIFPCLECGTVFEKRDTLRVHFVIEHTDNHYDCTFCQKKFHTQPALQRHLISHTKEKNFSCGVCGKMFFRKSTLELHMWIHSDVKKYVCDVCDKGFCQKISWKKHINAHHPELVDETV
ncbi:zinc finger protein 99-like isoform X22 [Ostrinia nubilalis]|uniref:zinc finger protein 99-like isoform X22 n=1 Tax=Ostrinia nubilalis TaxID=29057 RepID=UPI003082667D